MEDLKSFKIGPRLFIPSIVGRRSDFASKAWMKKLSKSDQMLTKQFESEIRELGQLNEALLALVGDSQSLGSLSTSIPKLATALEANLYQIGAQVSNVIQTRSSLDQNSLKRTLEE